jgi:hypothetical protein
LTRTIEIVADVDNTDAALRPGMYVEVELGAPPPPPTTPEPAAPDKPAAPTKLGKSGHFRAELKPATKDTP